VVAEDKANSAPKKAMPAHFQNSANPLDIGSWQLDDEFPIHPIGSKPKRVVTCPLAASEEFLIPRHSYLFKIAAERRAMQLWSELIAYQIGAIVGLDVPPAFVAVNSATGEAGVLIEFFYNFPDEPQPSRFAHAADLLQRLGTGERTDRPHHVRMNLQIGKALSIDDVVDWWARTLTFDALIGNTDRHPENWGWLLKRTGSAAVEWRLAPIFDNGTSLGWEIAETDLIRAAKPDRIDRYVKRGRHHCGWDRATDSPMPHFELCRLYAEGFPQARAAMRQVIDFDSAEIMPILEQCMAADVGVPFTADRVRFVSALIEARKRKLTAIIGA
jgi:hypothetical protein